MHQLRVWMEALDLAVHPRCRKRREPAARCPWCPPLFPRMRRGRGNLTVSDGYACSPQRMSDDVQFAMSKMGANQDRFSGVSARKGGLSTAMEAGIHEAVFCRQGTGKRRQPEIICTSGTRRYSCKSSGRFSCEGCVSRGVCVDRMPRAAGLVGDSACGARVHPRPSRPHDGMVGPARRPAAGRRAG